MIVEILKTFFYSFIYTFCDLTKVSFHALKKLMPTIQLLNDIASSFSSVNILAHFLGVSASALTLLSFLIKINRK